MNKVVEVHGAHIPRVGCGTWELRGEVCSEIVAEALRVGFRHIDTAQGYDNETAVGDGIRASGVPRDEIFITTKVRPQLIGDGPLQKSVEESLQRLGMESVDLLLIHWPNPRIPVEESMRALADARRLGLTRHIGVSNFTIAKLDEAVRVSPEPISVAQVELHPYLDQTCLRERIRHHGLATTAYCPLALGKVVCDPILGAIGSKYDKTAVQVALRWLIQQDDVIAIPRTSKPSRLRENLAVFDFALTEEEMVRISRSTTPDSRLITEPQWVPYWD